MVIDRSCGFVEIRLFGVDNPLSPSVVSDHCEISVMTSDGHKINAYNISNPAYHKYFSNDGSRVFAETHLATTDADFLESKIQLQLALIASRFMRGSVGIQVVVEGYETFYERLAEKLSSSDFHLHTPKPEDWSSTKNITGILVDLSKFKVCESSVVSVKYEDKENEKRTSELRVPYVHVKDLDSQNEMVVAGVHVPGAASQFPKDGLAELAKVIQLLWEKTKVDVIAMGDFNTTPGRVARYVEGEILEPNYWTHANPRFLAASKYDLAVVRAAIDPAVLFEIQPLSAVSECSRRLAIGLQASVIS